MTRWALTLAAFAVALAASTDAPWTEEDVVRRFVSGIPVEGLIDEIAVRAVRFDVSPEMIEELRQAGLPQPLIQAMQQRQAELTPAEPQPEPAPITRPLLRLHLRDPGAATSPSDDPPAPTITVSGEIDAAVRARLQLDADSEGTPFGDVALVVACLSARHVPDQWRSVSPLGRDFVSMPRHRLLEFLAGAVAEQDRHGRSRRVLTLPASIEIELDSAEPHDLLVGIAIEAAGRYYLIASDRIEALTLGPRARRTVTLDSGTAGRLASLAVTIDDGGGRASPPADPAP